MKTRYQFIAAFLMLSLIITSACGPAKQEEAGGEKMKEGTKTEEEAKIYTAELNSLNQNITDQPVSGSLTIRVQGDKATIELKVSSLAPNMMHLAHLHGYEDGSEASCPSLPDADKNEDGIVDLIETRDYSGITMIPFHDEPASLKIKTETYSKSDAQGNYTYSKVVSMTELSSAVKEKFGVEDFNFDDYVVYVHGVSDQATLPESVQSLPDVPAMVTLPVACGELE